VTTIAAATICSPLLMRIRHFESGGPCDSVTTSDFFCLGLSRCGDWLCELDVAPFFLKRIAPASRLPYSRSHRARNGKALSTPIFSESPAKIAAMKGSTR
jgi:hypothetical protein